jgi:hypothetical protein
MTTAVEPEYRVRLRRPHARQREFLDSTAKRVVVRAGRRGGKTTGMGIKAVEKFLEGRRVLYAAPTIDQVGAFWWEVKRALAEPVDAGLFYKNEVDHVIELPGTKQRIRAKTAWNADSLRGDFADDLIIDEWQLCDEDMWDLVGAPMLLDNDGNATFVYTPPSLRSRSVSKARDPRHAAKMYKHADADETGRWQAFHFTSYDNPHISTEALSELSSDMSALAIRQEIGAEDVEDVPGALFSTVLLERCRAEAAPPMQRIVVGVDPSGGAGEVGIVVCGVGHDGCGYVLDDRSLVGSPARWGQTVVDAYHDWEADRVVVETNFGGQMATSNVRQIDASVAVKETHSSRGKAVRAEPVATLFEQERASLVGAFPELEAQMTGWAPGDSYSPDRLDALVFALTELMLSSSKAEVYSF